MVLTAPQNRISLGLTFERLLVSKRYSPAAIIRAMKLILLVLPLAIFASPAVAKNSKLIDELANSIHSFTDVAPADQRVDSAFSPDGGSERLILKVINASQQQIRLAAYSFTSPTIVKALIAAKKRGVDVAVLADDKGNRRPASIAAFNLLVNADIPVRLIAKYAIHHDKYIIADQRHVQTGSFNYSQAAARSNSENVLVLWNDPELAASYLRHWQSRWAQGSAFSSTY